MADQYKHLVNKQYNSPIHLYSDRNVKEILQKETQILSNGAVGIDFTNAMTGKPANLQNSAVLRMLEEEENRKRSGQPGSLKRVAWPPPQDDESFVEQSPIQAQGGPVYPSGTQSNPVPQTQQTPNPNYQQAPTNNGSTGSQRPAPINTGYQQAPTNPGFQQVPTNTGYQQQPLKVSTNTSGYQQQQSNFSSFQPVSPQPNQQPPLSPAGSKSPVSFTSVAKPWSSQSSPSAPGFKSVQAPQFSSSIKSYQSSKTTEYTTKQQYQYSSESQNLRETQPVLQVSSSSTQESSFSQQYPSPSVKETQPSFTQSGFNQSVPSQSPIFTPASPVFTPARPVFTPAPAPVFREQKVSEEPQHKNIVEKILTVKIETVDPDVEPEIVNCPGVKPSTPKREVPQPLLPQEAPRASPILQPVEKIIPIQTEPKQAPLASQPKPATPVQQYQPQFTPQVNLNQTTPKPIEKIIPIQTEPVANQQSSAQSTASPQQGAQQNQNQPQQTYQTFTKPKAVEPPPSTITLRPQAPVSQAPPPLVTSQPATATLKGGKNLRGDLKWPPEDVREKMAAEKQHLIELSKGPACRPRKNCKDYTPFFEKHALGNTYPGYKIPPGTQFYDHNPMM